jgi:type VI protein secretion system component Hcp
MAIDGYMYFLDYNKNYLASESQVDTKNADEPLFVNPFNFGTAAKNSGLFEVEDFSFDIEQTLNIGSQSTGAGAGRPTFNAFNITRKIDKSSPILFQMACSGTPFQEVGLGLRKGSGGKMSGKVYLVFRFKLVAVKTISWSYDDESPKEAMTFEYGGLQIHYTPQKPDGSPDKIMAGGWNRVKNVQDTTADPIV